MSEMIRKLLETTKTVRGSPNMSQHLVNISTDRLEG